MKMDKIKTQLQQAIQMYAIDSEKEELLLYGDDIIEAAEAYMALISSEFTKDDIGKLLFRLTNNCDTYRRKVLSGLTLAYIMGIHHFTQEMAGRLTGTFVQMVFGSEDSAERTSVILMMRDSYVMIKK